MELIHEQIPNKLILGTEVYEYFCTQDQMQNFAVACDSNSNLLSTIIDRKLYLTGYDYLGESLAASCKGLEWCTDSHKHVVFRPVAYSKSIWSEEPVVHFSVMHYSYDERRKEHWTVQSMQIIAFPTIQERLLIPYMIVSNCDEVHLFLNGKQFFILRPSECKNGTGHRFCHGNRTVTSLVIKMARGLPPQKW